MPDSQQIPDWSSTALPRVLHKPLSRALLSESWAQAEEAKRMERAGDDLQLTYEAYAAGDPCRACGRALLGEPALGTDEESLALIDADNAEFRAEHAACNMGVWRLENNRVEHCPICAARSRHFRRLSAMRSGSSYARPHCTSTAAPPGEWN